MLLVDADLRNPHLHLTLGGRPDRDFRNICAQRMTSFLSSSAAHGEPVPDTCRHEQRKSSGIGRQRAYEHAAESIAAAVRWIIVDSPPAAAVSDAALLANYCDGVLMVVRSNATPFDIAQRARQEFGDNLIGVVLNGISTLPEYSQYYYNAYGKPNGHGQGLSQVVSHFGLGVLRSFQLTLGISRK